MQREFSLCSVSRRSELTSLNWPQIKSALTVCIGESKKQTRTHTHTHTELKCHLIKVIGVTYSKGMRRVDKSNATVIKEG